jgi:acyl-CoA thioester hydrolase
VHVNFIKYTAFDETLFFVTKMSKPPAVKQSFEYEVYNTNKELICTGSSLHTFINKDKKATRLLKELLQKLKPYFNL